MIIDTYWSFRKSSNWKSTTKNATKSVPVMPTSTNLAPASIVCNTTCIFSETDNHNIVRCEHFEILSIEGRRQYAKKKQLCFLCLDTRHRFKQCNSRVVCTTYNGSNNTMLHIEISNKLCIENTVQSLACM